jgi:uncharacterized repeat protein (TIGR03803 family)
MPNAAESHRTPIAIGDWKRCATSDAKAKSFVQTIFVFLLLLVSTAWAESPDRITAAIDSGQPVVLKGSVSPQAQAKFDRGAVDPSMILPRITMLVKPSSAQQSALDRLLSGQQDPSSPNYHNWLTPEQFGDRFGLSRTDLENIVRWLQSEGFAIVEVAHGRNWITFSGTAAQVERTFRTQIHRFDRDGEEAFANVTEASIPKALEGIAAGFRGLDSFRLKPAIVKRKVTAEYTDPNDNHFLAPDDIAAIYDLEPLYQAGVNGTGMKIAIMGQSDFHMSDIENFRSGFNLPSNDPTQILATGCSDPGYTGDEGEADLDLEWSGAIARNASIIYVNCDTSSSSGGVFGSLKYAIDNNTAPVLSMSYGTCEANIGQTSETSYESLIQQANAQGQTLMVSTGDSGAAMCDAPSSGQATNGLAVNGFASPAEVTAVGGTEFNGDVNNPGQYWGSSNGANGGSAISYIPELAWNDSSAGTGLATGELSSTGGGASTIFKKPSFQTGPGVPNDGARDLPDVSMPASAYHDGYIFCTNIGSGGSYQGNCASGIASAVSIGYFVGGTSAASPVFAGIVVLLNQSLGNNPPAGLGNINPTLYTLAQKSPSPFHDVPAGSYAQSGNASGNIVPCAIGAPNCTTGTMGFATTTGYDQATGLGSVDANAFVTDWPGSGTTPTRTSTTTTADVAPVTVDKGATSGVTLSATVNPASGSGTPTGTITFLNGSAQVGQPVALSGGAATLSYDTSSLAANSYSITAAYSGDSNFAASTSQPVVLTVAPVSTNPAPGFTTLYAFYPATSGDNPSAALVQYTDGSLYGTTVQGGDIATCGALNGCGTVFKFTPAGALTTLHVFEEMDGKQPVGELVLASDGNFYGTTSSGGASNGTGDGTIFRMTPAGSLTTIYNFCPGPTCDATVDPSGLVQGQDGNFYGTTEFGGNQSCTTGGCGTVFMFNPGNDTLTTIYQFCSQPDCADGKFPQGELVQGSDGKLYGTTSGGGSGSACSAISSTGCGTIFSISTGGTLTTLHALVLTDGAQPAAGLVQGTDGSFYGTTRYGGDASVCGVPVGCGTVFKISPAGAFTMLYEFGVGGGNNPVDGLVQGTDGNFYGTTPDGGTNSACLVQAGCGTIFSITPAGSLTTLYNFSGGTDGHGSHQSLVQAKNGTFYGTANSGGNVNCDAPNGCGTIFSLTLSTPAITPTTTTASVAPSSVSVGATSGVTLSAMVNPASGNGTPTGTITFFNGTTQVGQPVTLSSETATLSYNTSSLAANSYSITAAYSGDSNFAGSTSQPAVLTVTSAPAKTATTTTASVAPSSVSVGATSGVTLTAKVNPTSGNGTPTGTITFFNGTTQVGQPVTLSSETATLSYNTSSLAANSYSITAAYSGDSNFAGSTSPPVVLTVAPGTGGLNATTTALTITATPSTSQADVGSNVTFTATVTQANGTAAPTGSVTFSSGTTVLGTGTVNSSRVATYSTAALAAAQYSVTAVYGGDSNYATSSSAPALLDVVDFQITANPATVTVTAPGQSGDTALTITPLDGFSQTFSFACSGLPSNSNCTFTSTSTGATMTIATTAPSASASLQKGLDIHGKALYCALLLPGFLGLVFSGARKRSLRAMRLLTLLCGVTFCSLVVACSGSGNTTTIGTGGTPPGTSTVIVTATAGQLSHQTSITLMVQ